MSNPSSNKAGFFIFGLLYLAILFGSLASQTWIVKGVIYNIFPNYSIVTDVLPSEWIIITNSVGSGDDYAIRSERLRNLIEAIRDREYSGDPAVNSATGKNRLKEFAFSTRQTLYFVNPYIAFIPMHLFFAGVLAFLLSMFIPGGSSLSWIRLNVMREYARHELILRKQFIAHALDFDPVLTMDNDTREKYIRSSTLPEVVIHEVEDFVDMHRWLNGATSNPVIPIKFYFRYRISTAYGNVIQGFVSGGAGILIFIIGLRGLKLIPAEEPSIILMALSLEFILLIVLMITFAGSAQEERLDRVVKELEAEQRDAIKQQTTTLHEMLGRTNGGGGGGGKSALESIADYEERRLLDELLHQMLAQIERQKGKHGV